MDQICAEIEKRNVQILKKEVTKHDNRFVVALVATFTGREFQNITKDVLEMPDVYSLYK